MNNLPSILCVDDEKNVLDGLQRILVDHFDVETATSGAEALTIMEERSFTTIVSDMRMPEMNGAEFLSRARKLSPDTTRILLTGQSDFEAAILAVNDGNIFRFLLKPCPADKLITNISEGVRLHQLIRSEKDLLENTLKGAIKVLIETLSMIAPNAFSRATHIKSYIVHMVRSNDQKGAWEFEIAAMLSQVGAIILPPELLKKAFSVIPLAEDEKQMLSAVPAAGAKLVDSIPRLENIALMIKFQSANDEVLSTLADKVCTGARMLRIANMVDKMVLREEISVQQSLKTLQTAFDSPEDTRLLAALASYKSISSSRMVREVVVSDLKPGMVLEEDVLSMNGGIVLCTGQTLNAPLIDRLFNFSKGVGIQEPFRVLS